MKNVLFCALAGSAAALLSPTSSAQDAGWFVSVGGARTSMERSGFLTPEQPRLNPFRVTESDDRDDRAFDARVGYRWALTDTLALGVEGGYADLGKGTANEDGSLVLGSTGYYANYHTDREQKSKAILLGANIRWHFLERWSLAARAGAARYKTSYDSVEFDSITGVAQPARYYSYTHRSSDYYAGLSLGFDVLSNLTVSVNYDQFQPDAFSEGGSGKKYTSDRIRATGVNLEYRF
ncbi:outer membrane beta-barrel protein [Luteibacter sp.]|uniref:outer membrane beta-barrel protein n=1 Tax=Luteibacter sp. TaxID=1886636 RepID=UPI003F80C766